MIGESVTLLAIFLCSLGVGVATYAAGLSVRGNVVMPPRVARLARVLEHSADHICVVIVVTYVLIFGILAVLRHINFCTGYHDLCTSWDLAQYDQIIWNSLRGRLFENSFVRDADTFLGKSFTPILLAFVPLYALWSDPIVLLVVQTLALAAAAFPIYWFARTHLGRGLALVVVVTFFLHPGLEYMNLAEFHEIPLAVPVLAFATFFLLRREYIGFLVSLVVALLIKEEIGLIAIAFGIFVFLVQRRRRLGLALMLFGVVWVVMLLQYVIPFFRGAEHGSGFYYFVGGAIGGGARYGYLGGSLAEIVTTLVTHPDIVWQHVVTPEKIAYVLHLFVPLIFLPLAGIEVAALALPTLGYSLLSEYGLQYDIGSYYFAPLLPFLFFATVLGAQRLLRWGEARGAHPTALRTALAVAMLVASVSGYFLFAPGPLAAGFQAWRYTVTPHTVLGNRLMARVPGDATVAAQNEYLAHLSQRKNIYEIPLLDYRQYDYLVADQKMKWYETHRGYWEHTFSTGYFESLADADGIVVARRRVPQYRLDFVYGEEIALTGYSIVLTDTLRGGQTLRPIVEWRAEKQVAENYRVAMRVVDREGHVWAEEDREPIDGLAPTSQWEVGRAAGDQFALRLPPTMPPGDYQITLGFHDVRDNYLPVRDARGNALDEDAALGAIHIEKDKSSYTASDVAKEQPLVAYFVDMQEMRLLGYVPVGESIQAGEVLQIGLYWKAREKPRGDYVVAVQLRDANGRVALEQSARPANGTYPTMQWDAGEVLLDWHDLVLPPGLAPGKYEIYIVLRDGGCSIGTTQISTIAVIP